MFDLSRKLNRAALRQAERARELATRPAPPAPPGGVPPGLDARHRHEWLRCQDDPVYFCNQYAWIEDLDCRLWVRFRLWAPGQEDALRAFKGSRRVCCLKARQQGFSWIALADALHDMTFHPIASVLLFSKTDRDAMKLVGQRLAGMWRRLPDWMRPPGRSGAHLLQFDSGSRAESFPTTGGRSYTGTLAVIDEADYVPDLDDLLAAVRPTVDASGRLLLISTTDKSKPTSAFKQIYRAGEAGGYRCLFYPWSIRPGRTPEWYARERAECLATRGVLDWLFQEYPSTADEALAANVLGQRFPPEWVSQCYEALPALDLSGPSLHHLVSPAPALAQLQVYRLPAAGRRYAVGADPAKGNPTSDDSALSVHDRDTGEQVAELSHKFEVAVFASHVAAVARWYNNAQVLVEENNHGLAVIVWLRDNAGGVYLMKGHTGSTGWTTTSKSKALMYDRTAERLRDRRVVIHSAKTKDQLLTIQGADLSAPEALSDDAAVAFGLGCVACDFGPAGKLEVY